MAVAPRTPSTPYGGGVLTGRLVRPHRCQRSKRSQGVECFVCVRSGLRVCDPLQHQAVANRHQHRRDRCQGSAAPPYPRRPCAWWPLEQQTHGLPRIPPLAVPATPVTSTPAHTTRRTHAPMTSDRRTNRLPHARWRPIGHGVPDPRPPRMPARRAGSTSQSTGSTPH